MKNRNLLRFVIPLTATTEASSTSVRDFEQGRRSVWQNVGIRGFYGPWNVSVKRKGDYVDYHDYGSRIERFWPNSLELQYDDLSIADGYLDPVPSVRYPYDSDLSELNTVLGSVGIADFRTGVRAGDWIDRNTDALKEGHWQDIASQKA